MDDYTVFTDRGNYTVTANSAAHAANKAFLYGPAGATTLGVVRADMAGHVKPQEPAPRYREFTVTFTVSVELDESAFSAREVASDVESLIDLPTYYAVSAVTVTENKAEPPAVPLLPWDLARAGAAVLRDTGIWEYPTVPPPASSPEDEAWDESYYESDCF